MKAPLRHAVLAGFLAFNTAAKAASYDSVLQIPSQNAQSHSQTEIQLGAPSVNELSHLLIQNSSKAFGVRDARYEHALSEMFADKTALHEIGLKILSAISTENIRDNLETLLTLAAEHPAMKEYLTVEILTETVINTVGVPLSPDETERLKGYIADNDDIFRGLLTNIWMVGALTGTLEHSFVFEQQEFFKEGCRSVYEALGYEFSPVSSDTSEYDPSPE